MVRSRRELHHSDGITDPNNLQQISATKSAITGLMHCSKKVYSITSSALACSVCGTVSPSAFAVLRLITNSYLVGVLTEDRPVLTLEDAINVSRSAAGLFKNRGHKRRDHQQQRRNVRSKQRAACIALQAQQSNRNSPALVRSSSRSNLRSERARMY